MLTTYDFLFSVWVLCLSCSIHVRYMISVWLQITSSLQMELNRLYASFVARNPYFEANGGKVSIVAHSLGEKCIMCKLYLFTWFTYVMLQFKAYMLCHVGFNDCRSKMPSVSQSCSVICCRRWNEVQVSERNWFLYELQIHLQMELDYRLILSFIRWLINLINYQLFIW